MGKPKKGFFATAPSDSFSISVAQDMYMRTSWRDTMYKRIIESPLGKKSNYIYSDNDFIFLGKLVETISGLTLNDYVKKEF